MPALIIQPWLAVGVQCLPDIRPQSSTAAAPDAGGLRGVGSCLSPHGCSRPVPGWGSTDSGCLTWGWANIPRIHIVITTAPEPWEITKPSDWLTRPNANGYVSLGSYSRAKTRGKILVPPFRQVISVRSFYCSLESLYEVAATEWPTVQLRVQMLLLISGTRDDCWEPEPCRLRNPMLVTVILWDIFNPPVTPSPCVFITQYILRFP